MESNESNKELLLSRKKINAHFKYAIILKWVMKITMWISFVFWAVLIFMYPLQSSESLIRTWTNAISSSCLGFTGSAFAIFGGPVVVISLLSAIYIVLDSVQEGLQQENVAEKEARFRMGTFPIIVKGGFGVISAAEMIGIMVFGLYLIWVASVYSIQKLAHVFSDPQYATTSQQWSEFMRLCGKGCGLAGLVTTSFMIVTITRGSTILRVLNIHSQQAVRYHIWLSHLSLSLFTLHAFLYLFGWFLIGGIPSKMILWQSTEVAHLPGIINILFGWIIWITSIPFIRSNYFELFYFTHYLYILFIVFLAMHIGNFLFCIAAGPVFLFIIDCFLRLFQCQHNVDVISATCFPCDVVQLVMPITPNLKHNALCSIWVRVKEISSTQWHPFSVTTTPLDGRCRLAVLIKASGNWTSQLKHKILNHPTNLNVSIEGPYGYHIPHYLRFKNLILVAGGIGISPFMAVLSDIVHRVCRPVNILLIWIVKTSHHLSLLSTIDMETRSSRLMNLQIMIYVTQELHPQSDNKILQTSITSSIYPSSRRNVIYDVASSGQKIWLATYIISSTFGFVTITSTINILYIRPFEVTTWWFQALLLLASMLAGVSIFGGGVIGLWSILEKKNYLKGVKEVDEEQNNDAVGNNSSFFEHFSGSTTCHYGSRPHFKEIFGTFGNCWGQADVGVIACGPKTLEESVATECRSLNLGRKSDQPVFHFSCHSFNL